MLWTIVSPMAGSAAFSFLRPEGVSASDLKPGSIAFVLRVNDPALANALEDLIIKEDLPIAMFVDAKAASGLYPHEGIILGVAQHGVEHDADSSAARVGQ